MISHIVGKKYFANHPACLSTSLCDSIITHAECQGFIPATLNDGSLDLNFRNCGRCITFNCFHSDVVAAISDFLPRTYRQRKLIGINHCFRILKYKAGQFFNAHYDDPIRLPIGRTELTVMIYLNENYEGGQTTFVHDTSVDEFSEQRLRQKTGDMLIFDHGILHKGEEVFNGIKYVLRTDVIYSK